VVQHALGLWTSEVISDALDDHYSHDLETAEKRIQTHISRLEALRGHVVSKELVDDDIITLKNFLVLSQNQWKRVPGSEQAKWISESDDFNKVRSGFVQNVNYRW